MGSESFNQLLEISCNFVEEVYRTRSMRVAILLGMNPMRKSWYPFEGLAAKWVPGLEDSEWMIIQEHMEQESLGGFFPEYIQQRLEWVRALDTLREFERA